jgi:hypothetical protein
MIERNDDRIRAAHEVYGHHYERDEALAKHESQNARSGGQEN